MNTKELKRIGLPDRKSQASMNMQAHGEPIATQMQACYLLGAQDQLDADLALIPQPEQPEQLRRFFCPTYHMEIPMDYSCHNSDCPKTKSCGSYSCQPVPQEQGIKLTLKSDRNWYPSGITQLEWDRSEADRQLAAIRAADREKYQGMVVSLGNQITDLANENTELKGKLAADRAKIFRELEKLYEGDNGGYYFVTKTNIEALKAKKGS
jgi:hypothetical protein